MDIEIYPLPEWAERLNQDKELIRGTQLMTKNGMRIGNARIVAVDWQDGLGYVFTCRSDMGNQFRYTVTELHNQFSIGPYILKESELTARKIDQSPNQVLLWSFQRKSAAFPAQSWSLCTTKPNPCGYTAVVWVTVILQNPKSLNFNFWIARDTLRSGWKPS